jgi:hypothetical protein
VRSLLSARKSCKKPIVFQIFQTVARIWKGDRFQGVFNKI